MIRAFINGHAASAGGGLTYLRNVIPQFARRDDAKAVVLLSPELQREFEDQPNIQFVPVAASSGPFRRFLQEQMTIPRLIRDSGAQVLISAGNFAVWKSPVPQILLSRNSLYNSADFIRDVRARGDYALWADTLIKGWFARRSIHRAEITVAPSEAFARDLTQWSRKNVVAIHHGFDADLFTRDKTPLPASAQAQLESGKDALRLLFVSHYNYYRNFETLFRAIPILKQRLGPKSVKLYLTCRLNSEANPGSYRAEAASSLVSNLRSSEDVVELGTIPYGSLHHLYRACHVYVTPAYTESFAHPLVEAMSRGLPVVASDLPVHREICGDAALYFPSFSPEALAESVIRVHESSGLAAKLASIGTVRSRDFSWEKHVDHLLDLARGLEGTR
jgi:glycosyltransferase involved in cell wall biosynthesis